jgi:hypothetical protein
MCLKHPVRYLGHKTSICAVQHTNILALSGNRTHDPGARKEEDAVHKFKSVGKTKCSPQVLFILVEDTFHCHVLIYTTRYEVWLSLQIFNLNFTNISYTTCMNYTTHCPSPLIWRLSSERVCVFYLTTGVFTQSLWYKNELMWSTGGIILKAIIRHPVPVTLCQPQTLHGLDWDRTRISRVRGRRSNAWFMAWTHIVQLFGEAYRL